MERARSVVTGTHKVETMGVEAAFWMNDRYTVMVREVPPEENRGFPEMVELSIRRNDRQPIFDWRDVQRIKNDIVGPENEGLQLFPAESRLVDSSNQFWLFCIKDPTLRAPFGFRARLVSEGSFNGSVQRDFGEDRPDDCIGEEGFNRIMDKAREAGIDPGQRAR
jgi:hypothetical protein